MEIKQRDEIITTGLTAVAVWWFLVVFALAFQADILWDAVRWSPIPLVLWGVIETLRTGRR